MSGRAATSTLIEGDFALSVGLPNMPAPPGWRWAALTDIARLESGHTPSREHANYWNGGVPWIGIRDARAHHGGTIVDTLQNISQLGLDNSAARILPMGTVCLSRTASVGYVVVMGRPMATSQDFVNWVCSPEIDPHYLKHLLIAENEALFRFGKGSTHTTIYYPEVKAFHVCLPPLSKQRRIVAKLDALQSRSRRAKEALDAIPPLLERFRQSVLAAAFRGDLTADWRAKNPDVEPASELLKRIRAERRRRWEETELAKMHAKGKPPPDDRWKMKYEEPKPVDTDGLPNLPIGWTWASLHELAIEGPSNGYSPKSEGDSAGTRTLRLSATTQGRCILTDSTTKRIAESIGKESQYWLRPGDLLIQRANTLEYVGVSAIFDGAADTYIYPDLMMRIRVTPITDTQLVWRALSWGPSRRHLRNLATGTSGNMPKINGAAARGVPLPLPPRAEVSALLEAIDKCEDAYRHLEHMVSGASIQLSFLDRSILSKAFRGELVPQDPNDEPAEAMLARLQAPSSAATAAHPIPANGSRPARKGRPRK